MLRKFSTDAFLGASAASLTYLINLIIFSYLEQNEIIQFFIWLPILSMASLIAGMGLSDYILYLYRHKKCFNLFKICFLQSIVASALFVLLYIFIKPKFISDYLVSSFLFLVSLRIFDTLAQYNLLANERTKYLFWFFFIKSILIFLFFFVFIIFQFHSIQSYFISHCMANLFLFLFSLSRITIRGKFIEDFSIKRVFYTYASSILNNAISTLETSGLAVIDGGIKQSSFAIASRITSIYNYGNTFFSINLKKYIVSKSFDKFILLSHFILLILYLVSLLPLFVGLNWIGYIDSISSNIEYGTTVTLILMLTTLSLLRLLSSSLSVYYVTIENSWINPVISITSLGLTLLMLFFIHSSQNIYFFALLPIPTIFTRISFFIVIKLLEIKKRYNSSKI